MYTILYYIVALYKYNTYIQNYIVVTRYAVVCQAVFAMVVQLRTDCNLFKQIMHQFKMKV